MTYFNELTFSLKDDASDIYEQTRENPNEILAIPCPVCNDSLDEYADRYLNELFEGLGIGDS
ncbi:MAG: hypothetical protein FWC17_05505 [Treponema sp.]|nr:hypothetical protein [Treponema sp.]